MGGAYGHIKHVHEWLDCTFQDQLHLLDHLSKPELINTLGLTEKFDGLQLSFCRDRFARTPKEIDNGGIDIFELVQKFMHIPKVAAVVENAAKAILQGSSNEDKWYHLEILHPDARNVLEYDDPCLVFHSNTRDATLKAIERSSPEWRMLDNLDCVRQDLVPLDHSQYYIAKSSLMNTMQLGFSTPYDYVLLSIKQYITVHYECSVKDSLALPVAEAILNDQSFLQALKPKATNKEYKALQWFDRNRKTIKKNAFASLEYAWCLATYNLLKYNKSLLIKKPIAQAQKIANNIIARHNSATTDFSELLKPFPGIEIYLEGLVDQTFGIKMTGAFSVINRLLREV